MYLLLCTLIITFVRVPTIGWPAEAAFGTVDDRRLLLGLVDLVQIG